MNVNLTKKELRTAYKEKRMALSDDEVGFLSQKISENFILQFSNTENQSVNVFLPIKKFKEIDTQLFINYFFDNHIRVFAPKIIGDNIASIEIFPDSKFEINKWGILEPVSNFVYDKEGIDMILTPLLYCDSFGNRVGYGKGFYDRLFCGINKNSKKIGLNYFEPNENVSDVSEYDVRIDGLITPDNYLKFN